MTERTVRELRPTDAAPLAELFERLAADPDTCQFFHPHALDETNAWRIAEHQGRDVYLGCFEGDRPVGYTMLRGWDEGFEVPTLGVATDPDRRRQGVGSTLIRRALELAAQLGADQVILHVHEDHVVARRWYEAEGFRAEGRSADGQLTYRINLPEVSTQP
jgi:ribosomal protein S18 acetylase RimI-like enzyme